MVKTLKSKITLVYLCLVILIAVVGITSVANLYILARAIDGLMIDNYKSINALTNMLDALERQDNAVLTYINIDTEKGMDMFSENRSTFINWLNIESTNNITESGEKKLLTDINKYYQDYLLHFNQLREIRNNGSPDKLVGFYNTSISPDYAKLKQELKDLTLMNEKAMFDGKDKATNNIRKIMYIILVLSTAAVTGGFVLSIFFTNRFLMPMHSMTQTIKLVRAGDLNQQIDIISPDEIGELAQEFNNMTKRLQQYEQSTLGKLLSEKNKSVAIVKNISEPLIVLDPNYKIVLINDACEKFFNIVEKDAINKHFLEAIRNEELFAYLSSVVASKQDYKEKILNIKSGEDYYFNVIVTTFKDMNLKINGLIVVFQNVTQLKHLEKIRTDFIATISHEFKTPLTSIAMGISLLSDGSVGEISGEQKEILNTIKEDEERLLTLVNDLLELTRIESGKSVFRIQPCSISGIIETSARQFFELAEKNEVNLHYEADENLPKVNADFEKITWVINNLVSNALKYTNAGDEIFIGAFKEDGKMKVFVKDTGAGIPEEYQEKIFDKFVQVKGHDLEVRGTGLGLAVVKEIIEIHGGRIWCESRLDVGSNFTFVLPLA